MYAWVLSRHMLADKEAKLFIYLCMNVLLRRNVSLSLYLPYPFARAPFSFGRWLKKWYEYELYRYSIGHLTLLTRWYTFLPLPLPSNFNAISLYAFKKLRATEKMCKLLLYSNNNKMMVAWDGCVSKNDLIHRTGYSWSLSLSQAYVRWSAHTFFKRKNK